MRFCLPNEKTAFGKKSMTENFYILSPPANSEGHFARGGQLDLHELVD